MLKAEGKHILVIRFSAMGDVAILVPVLRAVTATYPHLKITILTRKFFKPIFKDLQNIKVFEADLKGKHKGIFGLKKLAGELKDQKIDAVADVHNVLRSNILKNFFFFYGIPVKQIDKGRVEKRSLTAEKDKDIKPLKPTYQRYADVFASFGYPVDLSSPQFPEKPILSSTILKITEKKSEFQWVGIAPFAQHEGKVYPVDLTEIVINILCKEEKLKIFLFSGGGEEAKKLKLLSSNLPGVIAVSGELDFEEELDLISNLDVMISMDSGNAHLAAMFGVPVVTLWGVTHPFAGFAAFDQPDENNILPDLEKYPKIPTSIYGNVIPEGYEDVMRSIPPEKVVEKVKNCLGSQN